MPLLPLLSVAAFITFTKFCCLYVTFIKFCCLYVTFIKSLLSQSLQDDASTCEDVLQPHSNNDIVIRVSRVVFGIIIGIIIVIILIIIIVYIITCVYCYKRKNGYERIN